MKVLRRLIAVSIGITILVCTYTNAYSQDQTLTSTIIAIVKAKPEIKVGEGKEKPQEADELAALAYDSNMVNPSIKEEKGVGFYGNNVLTIVDRL